MKNLKKFSLSLLLVLFLLFNFASCVVSPTTMAPGASETPGAESSPAPTFFYDESKLPSGVTVDYHPETGIPMGIDGKFTDKKILSTDDAFNALDEVKDFWGIKNPREEFVLTDDIADEYGTLYRLKQIYQGIEVYPGGGLVMAVSLDGEALYITTSYIPNIQISVVPGISEAKAEKIAMKYAGGTSATCDKLVVYKYNIPEPKLVWLVYSNGYEVFVDAVNGDAIHKIYMIRS